LKEPKFPIWIVYSESHYSVLFSTDINLLKNNTSTFDIVYYDELANLDESIILTCKVGTFDGPVDL
jgi:hypothetical protein